MQSGSIPLASVMGALALVVALILLAARGVRTTGLRRFGVAAVPKRLSIIESLALDRSRRVVLLRCDDREVVLLTAASGDIIVGHLGVAAGGLETGA